MSAHQVLPWLAEAHWEIPDPGDAAALPTSKAGIIHLVTAGAETRTLADPSKAGVLLTLVGSTLPGACVVTAASDVTQTTDENVMTFTEVGDMVNLISVKVSSAYKWRIMGNNGVALS